MIPVSLDAELTALESMSRAELRAAWSRQVRTTAPNVSTGLLRLALAHHLQSQMLGGVSKAIERKLQEIADGHAAVRVTPGTRFVREWRGKVHLVTMTDDGSYHWQDKDWASLSMIARTITGTQWSGPAFFGTASQKRAA
jgi:Protein of unknown function (DUF2924)